ncbi:DUF2189 domain-containing protein [Niveibacterium sp. SC-1]|uniref:DUF2189 domain-containing protein n=1 Tax=Niveibacterium sp. SC-1 TaxID=3135646 RepID=UPI0031204E01
MDEPLPSFEHPLGHLHFRRVEATRPFVWLSRALSDMRARPGPSLAWGALFAILGFLILSYASGRPYLFTAAISGFLLIGPLAAAGLYEISRRREMGQACSFMDSVRGLARHGDSLLYFGLFLVIAMISWERISAILFALFYSGDLPNVDHFYRQIFLSGDYLHFVVAYVFIGAAIAALLYSLSAISLPFLMDRESDVVTAMMASMQVIGHNLVAMILWAFLIVALVGIGFATWMLGLVITLPLLGHATWHAYRDLIPKD